MKILFIIDGLRRGGKERRFLELIEQINKIEEISFLIVLIHREIEYKISENTRSKLIFINKQRKKSFRPVLDIYRIAKRFQPDLIHSWSFMMTSYSLPAVILYSRRLINSQISDAPTYLNRFSYFYIQSRINFLFSSRIIANSTAGLKSYGIDKSQKSHVIYNGFDFNRIPASIDRNQLLKEYKISAKYIVAMVASFTEKKDYGTFIYAALEILRSRDDITFLCIGDGPKRETMQSISKGKESNIKFLGSIDNVEALMAICDVGVLATYSEGISNALLEFCASGVPVIATEGSGNEEIVTNNKNGLLFKQSDPDDLCEKIVRIVDNPLLRKQMGNHGRAMVKEKFSIDGMVNNYLDIYKKLINDQ